MKSVASQAVEKPPRSSGWRQSGEPPGPAASRLPTTGFETTDAMVSDLDSIGGFGLKFQIDLRRQFSHASGPGCGQRGACLINVLAVHDPLRVALPGPANRSRFRSAVARAETRVRALPPPTASTPRLKSVQNPVAMPVWGGPSRAVVPRRGKRVAS